MYTGLDSVVLVVLAFSVFRYLNLALQILIKPLEILQVTFYTYALSVLNLVLDIVLVPRYGIVGAAWATGLTLCLNYLLALQFVKQHIATSQDWPGIWKCALNVATMAVVVFLAKPLVVGPLSLGVTIAVGSLVYGGISYVNRPFRQDERDVLNGIIGRPLFPF